ncbi:MAG: 2-phospho-L-lactate guanylyltransferase [Myxococcota bacterium]
MIAAIVPVKTLASSKSRLFPALDRESVERLSVAMLGDVVDALLSVSALDRVAVVTPDPEVAAVVRPTAAEVLLSDVPGLNASLDDASATLAPGPDDATLVVLGDVAGARAEELAKLIDACAPRGVALAPSSDGGTSALVRRPANVIAAGFGANSAAVHRKLASSAGIPFCEVALPSLAIDIDEPEDLVNFANSGSAGARTRALIADLLPGLTS